MSSIARLLTNRTFNTDNIFRAINSLYSNVGANRDERDWTAILASVDPLVAAENALVAMYENPAYLLRNANNLIGLNYTQNQIVFTYYQLAERLGFTYKSDWAIGSFFANTASLTFNDVRNLAINDQQAGARPILTLTSNNATGFLAQSDVAGRLIFTDGTFIANLVAGVDQALPILAALKSGQVAAINNGNVQSTASTQTVTIGTTGNDAYDASGAGNVVQYVITGNGSDTITGGAGADIIYAGDGDDIIRGSQEDLRLDGDDGNDILEIRSDFTINGTFQIRDVEVIRLMADGLTLRLNVGGGMFTTARLEGFADGSSTIIGSNGPGIFIGGTGADTLTGGNTNTNDTFTGGLGIDILTGGLGDDTFNIDAGRDRVNDLADSDVFVISPGAELFANVSQEFTATAASRNLSGDRANAIFAISFNADFADFSRVTVANAATDGITIISDDVLGGTIITGTAGDDTISGAQPFLIGETFIGGPGADTINLNILFPGISDTLIFNSLTGADTINSYQLIDVIQMSKAVFTALGPAGALNTNEFEAGAGLVAALNATTRLVYNSTDGALRYDADGSGAGGSVLIGTFVGAPALVFTEFSIIA